jgi:hypothetical protein
MSQSTLTKRKIYFVFKTACQGLEVPLSYKLLKRTDCKADKN